MSLMCANAACKAKTGMCTHEKMTAGAVVLLAVGFSVARLLVSSDGEPVVYGVQGALRDYRVKEGPPMVSTLDHIVSAVAG